MSKVITFSRYFPAHFKKRKPTWFVEKLHRSFDESIPSYHPVSDALQPFFDEDEYVMGQPKHHTVRGGTRFTVGDMFSPRIWSGLPYRSKQVVICQDIEVKYAPSIRIHRRAITDYQVYVNGHSLDAETIATLSTNDGLNYHHFLNWFNLKVGEDFSGQIICWNDRIKY